MTWEQKLAKSYFDKLSKTYCLADLSKYKTNQIALRWRTQGEVMSGKGHLVCGNLSCSSKVELVANERRENE